MISWVSSNEQVRALANEVELEGDPGARSNFGRTCSFCETRRALPSFCVGWCSSDGSSTIARLPRAKSQRARQGSGEPEGGQGAWKMRAPTCSHQQTRLRALWLPSPFLFLCLLDHLVRDSLTIAWVATGTRSASRKASQGSGGGERTPRLREVWMRVQSLTSACLKMLVTIPLLAFMLGWCGE
jgi:hypothetical protein